MGKRERNTDQQLRNWLKHRPDIAWHKFHGSVFSVNQSDWLLCVLGRSILIEMKVPGEIASKGQALRQREWQVAGARTAVCDDVSQVISIVNEEEARMRRLLEYEVSGYT